MVQPHEPDLHLGTLARVQGDYPTAAGAFGMDGGRERMRSARWTPWRL